MRLFLLSLTLFLLSNTTYIFSETSVDNEILSGLNNIYNLKFDDAEYQFKLLQKNNPSDLKGYFYESLIYFYKALPTRNENHYEKYLDLSEGVIEKAEKLLDNNENDAEALYYKGLSHSYRSLIMLSLNKSLLNAASNGNDGYRILSSLIEKKPDYYDAYMGLGLYKIALGYVPEKFQWILSLIGFDGNISDGKRLLKTSMAKGKFTRIDSKAFLSIFSLKEKEDEDRQALDYSKELSQEYPNSSLFKIFYSSLLLQHGLPEEAIIQANESLGLNKNSFQSEIKKAANALLGSSYFRLNNFQKAAEHLEEFMKYVISEDRYNVYLFILGASYELNGNRTKAVEKYKAVRSNHINERDGELDKLFYRYAQEKISSPINEVESKLLAGMNLRESNNIDEALDVFNGILNTKLLDEYNSNDNKMRLYFDLGITYVYKNNYTNAIDNFNKCIALKPETEKWLIPHAYFELGKIYDNLGNKSKSKVMFDKIFDYDNFDSEYFLEMRLANYKNK